MKLSLFVVLLCCHVTFGQASIKGISFSAANKETTLADIKPIVEINANWISIVPYGFLQDNEISFNSKYQWIGERPEAIRACIKLAKSEGLKVMLKPHIWIGHGTYTGIYQCTSEEEWVTFEESYKSYILSFVQMAVDEEVELFSVGTEWGVFAQNRPGFWRDLIQDIRKVYDGELTYSANWDDYQKVDFWDNLDYIGIDAYFPLSLEANPKLSELVKSWKTISALIEQFASSKKKKVLFTEFGCKSTTRATISPWEEKDDGEFSEKVQDLAFQALFQTVWQKPWFSGGFVWKWYHNHEQTGGRGDTDFTPQNKVAEKTIQEFYGSN